MPTTLTFLGLSAGVIAAALWEGPGWRVAPSHPLPLALRRRHFMRHAGPGTESNFGLCRRLWDFVFGTAFKNLRAVRARS